MDMKFKKGDYIIANEDIRDYATLLTGVIIRVRDDTLSAYRIAWINKDCEYWSSVSFIDEHYSKTNKKMALSQ